MSETPVKVLVVGSGVMGRGIARGFARAGLATGVLSRDPSRVSGLGAEIAIFAEPPAEPPELIIESVPEVTELKLALYARIEAAYGGAPVLASNTSGLPLQELADRLDHPERFCGIHYFQPADVAPVVEVARVRQTSDATLTLAAGLVEASGKTAIVLEEPIPGLLINRLQHALQHEAYYLIERGITTAAAVDRVAKELLGPRMCVTGLIEQKDLSGLDTHALAQAAIVPHLHHGAAASPIVQDMHKNDRLGVKTGTGFYDWREMDATDYQARASALLARVLSLLEEERFEAPPLATNDA